MTTESAAVADFINVELTAILDETEPGWTLSEADHKRIAKLNEELKTAIKEGHYPMAALLEIRRIYSRKGNKNG